MAIIMDFSGIAMAGVLVIQSQLIGKTEKEYIEMTRHVVLNSVLSNKKKYTKEYGELIIACDRPSYWRKKYYKYYKASRKKSIEESPLDWDLIYKAINQVREDLINEFPYKVIWVEGAEADDVIACLTKYFRTEFGRTQKVLIVSSDNDMSQLQKYDSVYQWSPITKKMISLSKKQVREYINMSTVKGQVKDGIPNFKQADDALVLEEKKRAPTITQKILDSFLEKGIDACSNEEERKNYIRNQTLFDFEFIPQEINDIILEEYEKPIKKFNRMNLMNFLIKNRCRQLLNSLEEF